MRKYSSTKVFFLSRHAAVWFLSALGAIWSIQRSSAQDITLSTYNGEAEIKTYHGGSITLKNGFNTAGHNVHIYTIQDAAPVANVPTALSGNQNYIATWTATAPVTDPNVLITRPLKDVKLSVQYFDGLGRPVQTVLKQGSLITATGVSTDLVTTTLYDNFGRNNSTLLPYAAQGTANGSYRPNAETEQITWYNSSSSPVAGQDESGDSARTLTVFEQSPLGRVMESFAPGSSWIGSNKGAVTTHHSTKQKYWTNTATDNVRYWDKISFVTTAGSAFGTYTTPKSYLAGTLYKNVTEDELNRQVIEFKDKDGNTILKKVQLSKTDAGTGSAHTGWLCTYYLYDDLGNLRCVVQPEGVRLLEANSWNFTPAILKEQCFRYEYDSRNRMIIKQVPGAGPVYMVYDSRDRLVMTQDSVMRTSHKWLTTHYDDLNRADTTWLYTTPSSATFSSILAAAAAATKYPATAPTAATFLTETHYDNYENVPLPTGISAGYKTDWDTYFAATSTTAFPYPEKPQKNSAVTTKGLVTWSRVRVLDSTLQLTSVNIYDDKGRVIQTQSENITGGIDVTTTQYSWAGWPLVTVQRQQEKKGTMTQTTVVVTKMTYDDLGRLVKTEMKQSNTSIAGGAMPASYATISETGYDALGELKEKKIGKRRSSATAYTTTPLETQAYDYNIRGWLLGVNRAYVKDAATTSTTATATTTAVMSGEMFTESSMDLQSVTFPGKNFFGFDLGYDKRDNKRINGLLYDTARFDGNITGMTWKGDNDKKIRKYDFSYDPVSRLTEARFGQLTGTQFSTTTVNYNVNHLSYDGNGNILTMDQYGLKTATTSAAIDKLTYHYTPGTNKLLNVADAVNDPNSTLGDFKYPTATKTATTVDYTYDGNGNMISDRNKKITAISYNILNLPSQIQVDQKGVIKYYYDAAGNKLQKRTTDNSASPNKTAVTNYIGGAVYQNDTLQFFGTPDGRVRANTAKSAWIYDYFLKDHLGNTRMMITDDYNVSSPILEAYSYYPFGLQQKGIGLTASNPLHNYKNTFQKQELNEDLGVDMYEFKYRMDDPQIGRFWQVDPKSDSFRYNSTYAFSENKVVSHRELEGLEAEYIFMKAKRELANTFQAAANWLDKTFSVGSKTKIETSVGPNSGKLNGTISVENTTSVSTNAGPFMSFVIQHNTNNGYTGDYFKTTTKTTLSVGSKIDINTPIASGAHSTSIDQDGKTTITGSGSVKTISGLKIGVAASESSDGTVKMGGNFSIGSGNTTGKGAMTISSDGRTSNVETSIGAEYKINNTKATQTFFFKFGW